MNPRALKERAVQLSARGKFEKARALYEELIPLLPAEPQLRVRYAELCRKTGASERALNAYADAAELLIAQGLYARARAALTLAASLDPRHPRLGDILRKLAATGAMGTAGSSAGVAPSGMRTVSLEMAVAHVPAAQLSSACLPAQTPELKRLSAHAVAYRPSATSKWLVFSSETPIHVEERAASEIEAGDEPALPLELPVEPAPTARA